MCFGPLLRQLRLRRQGRTDISPPPERPWVTRNGAIEDSTSADATFTVLCYNVLCANYATALTFPYTPQRALKWEYRREVVMKEILHYDADIVALQEVETEQYRALFEPKLMAVGYSGRFFPKSRSQILTDEEEIKKVDGCALFWKTAKFDFEFEEYIEFGCLATALAENSEAKVSEPFLKRVVGKDNIAIVAALRNKKGTPLVVCNAHLFWDPEFCDVKLIQSMMLAHELSRIIELEGEKHNLAPAQIPLLVCGDFNSLPNSSVIEFLTQGTVAKDHNELKGFISDPCLEVWSTNSDDERHYTHSLNLASAISTSDMPWTNYTLGFRGMIDYIFASQPTLQCLGILGAVDAEWVASNKLVGFPLTHVPSDHIPIMARYAIVPQPISIPSIQVTKSEVGSEERDRAEKYA